MYYQSIYDDLKSMAEIHAGNRGYDLNTVKEKNAVKRKAKGHDGTEYTINAKAVILPPEGLPAAKNWKRNT
jgi:hypothetical protein